MCDITGNEKCVEAARDLLTALPGSKYAYDRDKRDGLTQPQPKVMAVTCDKSFWNAINLCVPPYPDSWQVDNPDWPLFLVRIDVKKIYRGTSGRDCRVFVQEFFKQIDPVSTPGQIAGALAEAIGLAIQEADYYLGMKSWKSRDWWLECKRRIESRANEKVKDNTILGFVWLALWWLMILAMISTILLGGVTIILWLSRGVVI